jgi:hypothetical protein
MFDALKKPSDTQGTPVDVFLACVMAAEDMIEKYLVSMGETEDISARNLPPERA